MNSRLTRICVLISLGGMTFAFTSFGWGCQPFAQNQPYVNFVDSLGDQAVAVGVDNALAGLNNQNLDTWLNGPLTTLYTNLWSGWVGQTFPTDPTFNTLLIN